ncbi:MAG TPA: 3-dehydroquinate synthase [Solirubrobacteraceae bacterium]|nr:3-dehydroquinate synthase [Solirubrobacteraceae bacterium]
MRDIMQEIVVRLRYPVRFTHGLFAARNLTLRDAVEARARAVVVVDGGLVEAQPSIPPDVVAYCRAHGDRLDLVSTPLVVPGGEAIKNDCRPVDAIRAAIDVHRIDRHAYVVAIGGGAVLDAVGYAAATAHRGVRLIRVPSTVLSQGDSAVGVKNGVNGFGKKNFVGTFAAPHAVLNDLDLLLTLSDRDWRSGISEAIKVALIRDAGFFAWIEERADALLHRSLHAMARLVHRSAELHLEHIATSGDPFELGSARPLDFGHWAAHKLEALTSHELRHGEAVAIGLAQDCAYAHLAGNLAHADLWRVIGVLEAVGLPIWHEAMLATGRGGRPAVLDGLEEFREHLGGRLTITLIDRVGSAFEVHELDEHLVLQASALLRRHIEQGALTG